MNTKTMDFIRLFCFALATILAIITKNVFMACFGCFWTGVALGILTND